MCMYPYAVHLEPIKIPNIYNLYRLYIECLFVFTPEYLVSRHVLSTFNRLFSLDKKFMLIQYRKNMIGETCKFYISGGSWHLKRKSVRL